MMVVPAPEGGHLILVTGATGNVGSQAAIELRDRGIRFRAFVRDAAKARRVLGDDIDLAVGDFEDAASIRRALEGVDAVFLCSMPHRNQVEHEIAVIDAAVQAGVVRLVKISTVGAEIGSECIFLDRHGRTEEHLRKAGIPWIIVRGSGFYMTNLLMFADQVRNEGRIFAPAEGAKIAMIDPRDVGSAAIVPLTAEGHDAQTYTLTGPAPITFSDIAEALSRVLDRPVEFVPVSDEAAHRGMTEAGLPDEVAAPLVVLFRLLRQGMNSTTTETMRHLTGRDARSIGEFVQGYAAAFSG